MLPSKLAKLVITERAGLRRFQKLLEVRTKERKVVLPTGFGLYQTRETEF